MTPISRSAAIQKIRDLSRAIRQRDRAAINTARTVLEFAGVLVAHPLCNHGQALRVGRDFETAGDSLRVEQEQGEPV